MMFDLDLETRATTRRATEGAGPSALRSGAPAGFLSLAERLREVGLFLVALRHDGHVAAHDTKSAAFFRRYLLPLIEADFAANAMPSASGAPLGAESGAAVTPSPLTPGIWVGSIGWIEKKHRKGTLLVIGMGSGFGFSDAFERGCRVFGLDPKQTLNEAMALPRYDAASVLAYARMLGGMAADQQKLAVDREELRSLSEQLSGSYEELSLVYQISAGMRVNRPATEFFQQLCLDLLPVLQVRAAGVALNDDFLVGLAPTVYGQAELDAEELARLGRSLLHRLKGRTSPLIVADVSHDGELSWLAGRVTSLLAIPMASKDRLLGCLFAIDKRSGEFGSADAKLVASLAEESSIYLENSRLFEDLHGLLMGLLHSLTSAIDAKDPYTCGHSQRVALLSRHLARAAGLSDADVEQIYVAALLHDVGKIGVPEAVLHKTGHLTDEEFALIKLHPATGSRILADIGQLRHVLPGVLHHHERFDGRGYPDRLVGEAIPLMGRIICLADSFDAMTSDRTYRKGMPIDSALLEIGKNSGVQFDPGLTANFLKTTAEEYRELLRDHGAKARKLLQRRGKSGVKFEEYNHLCVLRPEGDLAGPEADALLRAAEGQGAANMVVDFEIVPFISGQGLESLLAVAGRCKSRMGSLRLARLNDVCRQILRLTRLEERFECHGSVAEAMK